MNTYITYIILYNIDIQQCINMCTNSDILMYVYILTCIMYAVCSLDLYMASLQLCVHHTAIDHLFPSLKVQKVYRHKNVGILYCSVLVYSQTCLISI